MFTRKISTALAVPLAAVGLALATPAGAQTIELKVSHFLPPNHTFQKAMVAWASELEKQSNGRLKLQIYPAGQLGGGPNRQFDAARNGIVDVAISLHGATPGRYAMTELVSLPYASPKAGSSSAIASKRLTELAPAYLAKEHEGLRILWMAVTPPLMFHSKSPIRTIEDFKGLRVRYAGAQFKNIIDALGAVPLLVPPQETQDALSKGIVDAATFPYEGAASFDLGTIAKNTLEPGVSSASFAVVMNPAKYNSLPADLKALIDKTTGPAAAESFGKMWDEAEAAGKASLLAKGVQVHVLPDSELSKMKKLFAPQVDAAIAAVEKQRKPGRKFFDDYTK
ncbi:MAG TPA: TRAP transporter substrate-binding protein [Xanthobacteraceae bacterium]|nr:TRAP transporter substrate-binding protein [Xanthobacteraceae bacterium]